MQLTARDATRPGEPALLLTLADGRIAAMRPATEEPALWAAPALIDLQVNGFAGHDFNAPEPSAEAAAAAVLAQRSAGVGLCLPTVTTASFEQLCQRLRAITDACAQDRAVARAVAGIHLEGPYISPQDGPRGAHPLAHARPPDADEFARFQEAARGMIRLVTLAPELLGAVPLIERLAADGIVVALGHHAAGAEQIDAAARAGARLCTHLGNGAHAQLPRHPNYIWEQLGDDRLQASFIVDGHHLPPSVVRCMLRAKGLERSILVSDAIFLAGMPPGEGRFMDARIELTPEGRVNLAGTPYLAGSALRLCDGVANAARFAGQPLAAALRLATANPAALLGIADTWGALAVGRAADLMLFGRDADGGIEVRALLAAGDLAWGALEACAA